MMIGIGRLARVVAVITAAIWTAAAIAQTAVPPPPVRPNVDKNGVDVVSGAYSSQITDISIGPDAPHGLKYTRYWSGEGWRSSMVATISGSGAGPTVSIGGRSERFSRTSSTSSGDYYSADKGNGATLFRAPGAGNFTYTSRDGTTAYFIRSNGYTLGGYESQIGWASWIQFPDGTLQTFTYKNGSYCIGGTGGSCVYVARIQSVTNNHGYQLKFTYALNSLSSFDDVATWQVPSRVSAINNAVEYCDPAADSCSAAATWPHVDYGYTPRYSELDLTSVTDPEGRTVKYSYHPVAGTLTAIRRPGAGVDDVVIGDDGGISIKGVAYSYTVSNTYDAVGNPIERTTTSTDPNGKTIIYKSNATSAAVKQITNEVGGNTYYVYPWFNDFGEIVEVTQPDGNKINYAYDARNNITQTTYTPKPGSGLPTMTTYASYDAICSNQKTCNQPNSTTDERGQVTDYVYDAGTGLVTSIKAPAPAGGVVRPETRYYYSDISGSGLWLPVAMSTCRTNASCSGGSDETRIETTYGDLSKNYLPISITNRAGDSSISATTSLTYDNIGNVVTTTDPLGNVSYAYYNADRQTSWTVSPDPDGSGTLRHRATATLYNADGSVASRHAGAADPGIVNWVELQRVAYDYDGYGRKISESRYNGGAVIGMTQYGYDTLGRLNCTAVRMNTGAYGALPACTSGTSGGEQDRITIQEYDDASRPWKTTEGYTSGVSRPTVTNSYTDNGKLASLTDAKGNVTTYEYDGFDRLQKTRYPNASGGGSSTSDYEEMTYGTSGTTTGLVTSRRLRDGHSTGYDYDLLGRVTKMTPYAYTGIDHPIDYTYDNLGHTTQLTDAIGGHTTAYAYDALGRTTWETGPWRAKHMVYDAAGRMTSLDYGDGYSVSYTYDALNEMTGIYENGSTWLVSYGYDDLGRRIWMSRANGVSSALTYDNANRLTNLSHDLAGTSNDFGVGLTYNAANQITQRTNANDAYSWTDAYNVNRGYATNGLNQYTSISSSSTITPTYDGRGNLTNAGGLSYSYTARNQLYGVSNGGWLYYDAVGRLDAEADGTGCKALLDNLGSNIDAELDCNSGATMRRYIYGPDNAPAVWYEGSGTGDKRWLIPDERGSVVAVTDGSGNAMRINTYDEYGIPGSNNLGRFQYTGQAWLPSIGMYYARARIYSPTLGRFMQADPIGYGDGPNWYNYVGGDPINNTDPSGQISIGSCAGDEHGNVSSSCSGSSALAAASAYLEKMANLRDAIIRSIISQLPRPDPNSDSDDGDFSKIGLSDVNSEYASNFMDWIRTKGREGERVATAWLSQNGYTIIADQVYVKTTLGMRITDILAVKNGTMFGYEVKYGPHAWISSIQQQKDWEIQTIGGELRSHITLPDGREYGDMIKYRTRVIKLMDIGF